MKEFTICRHYLPYPLIFRLQVKEFTICGLASDVDIQLESVDGLHLEALGLLGQDTTAPPLVPPVPVVPIRTRGSRGSEAESVSSVTGQGTLGGGGAEVVQPEKGGLVQQQAAVAGGWGSWGGSGGI